MSGNEPPAALSDCGERRGSPAAGATAIAPHLVFLPDRAAPRFFVWGAGAAAAPLFAHGKPECVPLVDEALAPRELHGVAVPLLDALTRLAATTAAETERAPASLAAWSLAAKLALDLVGRERIVPRVVSGKGGTEARFAVALALPEDAERVAALAKGFPLAAHAVPVGDAGLGRGGRRAPEVWAPEALLRAFLDATADALVRAAVGLDASRRPRRRKAGHVPWERRFIAALAGPDAAFAPEGFRERTLVRDLDGWTRPALGAAPGAPRACFRLDLPAANGTESGSGAPVAGAFPLRFFLQAADDPSLLVPASEVLGGRGQALRRLGRSFHDGAEHLLGAVAVAARLFAPIGRSLREARPEAVLLDASEAWAFLTEGAPALAEAGIGVILPAELTRSGQRRLRLRMRVGGAQKGAAGAVAGASGLTAAEVMSFRWEAALAGETLSARDFAALAELKAPLVRFRGEWVAVDPTELAEVRRLVASGGGTLAAHEGLAAVLGETVRRPDGHVPVDVVAEGPLASLVTRLREGLAGGGPPVPSDFHGRLRPYQERGLGWLVQMSELGLGACLADDMGLGKTIQLLALLPRLGQSVQARRGRALRTGRGVRPGSIPAVRAAWPRQGGRARRAAAVPRRAEQRGARGEGGCSQQRRSRPHGHAGRPGPGGVRAAPWPARRLAFPDRAARIARDALAPARCAAVVVARRSSSRSPRSALPGGGRSRARSRAASNRRARPDLRPERCAP